MIGGIRYAQRLFRQGSVNVTGMRGRGKDLLMSNVACRSRCYYSNIDYGGNYHPLKFSDLDIRNDYDNLVTGNITPYVYPYEQDADIYISDIGIYFPAQYCNDLNRKYPRLPYFLALSRHLGGRCSVHLNVQNLNRCWDKFRELSDVYVLCRHVFKPLLKLGIVVQQITIYDKYQSCIDRVVPFQIPKPSLLAKKETKLQYEIEKQRYFQTHGYVKNVTLVYRNKSQYNDRHFKTLLEAELA